MAPPWKIYCDAPELAVDLGLVAERIGLPLETLVESPSVLAPEAERCGLALSSGTLTPNELVKHSSAAPGQRVLLLARPDPQLLGLASDLGWIATSEVAIAVGCLALLESDDEQPWGASTQALSPADRDRLGSAIAGRNHGEWTRTDGGVIAHRSSDQRVRPIGSVDEVARIIETLRRYQPPTKAVDIAVEGVEREAVMQTILGPPRALSDPASKSVLAHYDVPLPFEELCATPSRAASEAARIGFPVRMTLASPDLRVWNHPDLRFEGLRSAAEVRAAFREMLGLARVQDPQARVLGVTVSAATFAKALLNVRLFPTHDGRVLTEIGFADPHGLAADDRTLTILPASAASLERVLNRLQGHALLMEGNVAERRTAISRLGEVLLRLAAFVRDWSSEVNAVEVKPLAMLVGGEFEVRQACIVVSDAFTQSLDALA